MKLSKKDKKLMLELLNCELYAHEQSVGVMYDQKRVSRIKKLRLEIGVVQHHTYANRTV